MGSPSCSILLNGSPTGYIRCSKGLHQGDPLSYLFTLVMEVLSAPIEVEILKGNISLPKVNYGISHIMFADDILVFCKGDISNLLMVEKVFNYFSEISGLHISKEKSVLFNSGSCLQRTQIFSTMG